jgi:two-component system nitrate/nitrite response regulator NarL
LINIFLISSQPVLLRGFELIFHTQGFRVTGSCDPSVFTISMAANAQPELVLLDVTEGFSFEKLGNVHVCAPGIPLVLWSDPLPFDIVFRAMEFGVRGLVSRKSSPAELVNSVHRVAAGELQIGFGGAPEGFVQRRPVTLTPRECEIVENLRRGVRNREIAGAMGITEGTVKIYLFRLFQKLGVRSRLELAQYGGNSLPAIRGARVSTVGAN